ncbi:hypothetical protein [Pseudomonas viridiflava]|uniref:hypothetical protein n=1 Tax=Pseudomonas viridiflava TaxID=33069 RepID=UPI002EC82188|nr:hypothetical protein [Pseudomonas viridiflava]
MYSDLHDYWADAGFFSPDVGSPARPQLISKLENPKGYDSKSIQEYLMPMDLSVILCVSSVQNYTASGLLTLFQHYLKPLFDDASMFDFNCAFDPVCTDIGNSCSGCIQIEIGCETFNHGLSRAYIHGGQPGVLTKYSNRILGQAYVEA